MLWLLAALMLYGPTEMVQAQQRLKDGQKLMATERFEEAAVAFRDAIRLDPLLMMAHYGLGQTQMALKNYPDAITAFKGAREAFNMRVAVGVAHKLEGDNARQERARYLRDLIRQNTERALPQDSPEARERDRRITQWEQEIASLDRSTSDTRKTPDLPPGLPFALGSAYFRSGQLTDAEREYRAAVAIQPALGEPHNNLAVVLLMTGRAAEAQEELKLAEKNGFKVNPGLQKDVDDAVSGQAKAPTP
jgi:tetratricopeptide (TPR) repeat protein